MALGDLIGCEYEFELPSGYPAFGRLKDFRRIATRYDKRAENFLAALHIAALISYWI